VIFEKDGVNPKNNQSWVPPNSIPSKRKQGLKITERHRAIPLHCRSDGSVVN